MYKRQGIFLTGGKNLKEGSNMKTRIFIFIIILALLVACIGHLDSEKDFMIRVGTGFKERTGKDYIQWLSLIHIFLTALRRITFALML